MTTFTMTAPPSSNPAGIAPPVPILAPAAVDALRQQAAALLQHTYRWLEEALPAAPQLSTFVPSMVAAVQLYAAQQYPACLRQVALVIEPLRQARIAFPTLPPL